MKRWQVLILMVVIAGALMWVFERQLRWWLIDRAIDHRFPGVPSIDVATLAERLDNAEPPLLLDARLREEWDVSHISGARWIGPTPDVAALRDELDPEQPIIVYCSVGYRSADVTQRLLGAGFENVVNVEGSIFRWANEGRPLVGPDGELVEVVHPYDEKWGKLLDPEVRGKERSNP